MKQDLAPYSERLADELAESFNLTAFTAYKFGNDIECALEVVVHFQHVGLYDRRLDHGRLCDLLTKTVFST